MLISDFVRYLSNIVFDGRLQTRDTSSQCDEGNSIDGILQVDEAAQMTGDITNNSSAHPDHADGNDEGWVTIGNSFWERS